MPVDAEYACSYCSREFDTRKQITRHNREVHGILPTPRAPSNFDVDVIPCAYSLGVSFNVRAVRVDIRTRILFGQTSGTATRREWSSRVHDLRGRFLDFARFAVSPRTHSSARRGAVTRTQSGMQLVPRVPILAKTTRKRSGNTIDSSRAKRPAPPSSAVGHPQQSIDVDQISQKVESLNNVDENNSFPLNNQHPSNDDNNKLFPRTVTSTPTINRP